LEQTLRCPIVTTKESDKDEHDGDSADDVSLSFVACVSDQAVLESNLTASPCLGAGSPHEFIAFLDPPSAASALNAGLERARHGLVVCVHQDVSLPPGWDRLVARQYRRAERQFGAIGVAGVYGVGDVIPPPSPGIPPSVERIGHVVDRERLIRNGTDLPSRVATLDELLLIVPRESPLRFDPDLGFHLYGADLCLQARERGLAVVALEAPCRHNSRNIWLPGSIFPSALRFARKWADRLPVATPCVLFDRGGSLFLLGNADPADGTTARPEGLPLLEPSGAVQPRIAPASEPIEAPPCPARSIPPDERGDKEDYPARPIATDRRAPSPHDQESASVIVPCFNQLAFTKLCLQALIRNTRPAWELIVIDNGSTDGTGEYLAGLHDGGRVPVTVITNPENLGFPAAVNQGLKAARGEYLVLLNNDAVVTDGWLDQLIALTRVQPEGGVVKPPLSITLGERDTAENQGLYAPGALGAGLPTPTLSPTEGLPRSSDALGAGLPTPTLSPTEVAIRELWGCLDRR
jgi:hypothetical protein